MKTPTIVGGAALAAALIGLTAMMLAGGWGHDGVLQGVRVTARWSFAWFITAWSASSIAKLWPGGWRTQLLRRRRAIGLGFAFSHFVHAVFFVSGIVLFGIKAGAVVLVGGGIGYLLTIAMAATSNDAAVKALGPSTWKLLHSVGGWYLLAIFFNSYLFRLVGTKPLVGAYGVGLIALALTLRIAAFAKGRMRLQAA